MTVNLSIKDVPDDLAVRLRERAQRHHRSLQGELHDTIEAVEPEVGFDAAAFLERVRGLGAASPSESVEIVRHMRDSRYGD